LLKKISIIFSFFQIDSKHPTMGEAGEEVQLYVYDLTGGMAKVLGPSLLRK